MASSYRKIALITCLVTLFVGGAALLRDAGRERQIIVDTPAPPPTFDYGSVRLKPGADLCLGPVTFQSDADQALLNFFAGRRPAQIPSLDVTVTAGGKSQKTALPAHVQTRDPATAAVPARDGTVEGKVCVENTGDQAVAFVATREPRFQTATKSTIDGKPAGGSVELRLTKAGTERLLTRFDDAVRRASIASGGVPKPLLWLLLIAVVIGMPVAAVVALLDSFDHEK